jgi:hypothetical protein
MRIKTWAKSAKMRQSRDSLASASVGALNPVTLSAPVPRAVPDMQDFDDVFHYAVGSYVRQG